ncbi:hypothetical protein COCMIDRAFT_94090 [Bipolaris oryzae ATCC 44560]|uniref:Uncharacterized protein n=1 Tax=Bipolaris oryzae ATCC 44560 TaxID=930090 RepID=W6Z2H5_COCMI|nr:uncharacterized protein COCMIDRAFT_94090 [Bipolaris oryzae ATCC 44560]EUC45957.1 hypothetical protein COCMIDRAFT_94090 [Bipolaris oryzae ATCC 44560]
MEQIVDAVRTNADRLTGMFKPKEQALFAQHAEIFAKMDLDENGMPKSDETEPAVARFAVIDKPAVTSSYVAAPVVASAVPTYFVVTTPPVAFPTVDFAFVDFPTVTEPTAAASTMTVPAVTTGNITDTNYSQMAKWRDDKEIVVLEKESKLKTAKRRDLQQQQRQMLVTKNRIENHRAQRAQGFRVRGPEDETEASHPQPVDSPAPDLRPSQDMSFYENQTYKESHDYVQEQLTHVLGAERMNFQILPSGHNPIDPVIAEYNQQKITNSILDQWEAHKVEMRRREEERKRQAHEEEVRRFKIQTLLDHYRQLYINRLEQLALYGRDLVKGIGYIEAALMAGGLYEAANIMQDMTHQVLLPIHTLLQKCDKEIPLEEVGAEKLKSAWPMEGLVAVFEYLRGEPHLPPEAIDMMQGIQVICKALDNPTPFQDPLAPKPVFNDACKPTFNNNSNWQYTPHPIVPAVKPSASEGISVLGAASAPAGSGFSKLLAATAHSIKQEQNREPCSTGSGFAKLLATTTEKANSAQEASSDSAPNVSPNIIPKTSPSPAHAARTAVLQYIATENLYFESEVQDLIRNNTVMGTHRRQASECLKELIGLANGEEGFLGDMDAGNYRMQIEKCVTKINTLPTNPRMNRDTQALKKLCGIALKLWSVHAK